MKVSDDHYENLLIDFTIIASSYNPLNGYTLTRNGKLFVLVTDDGRTIEGDAIKIYDHLRTVWLDYEANTKQLFFAATNRLTNPLFEEDTQPQLPDGEPETNHRGWVIDNDSEKS